MLVQGYGIRNPAAVHYEAFPFNYSGKSGFLFQMHKCKIIDKIPDTTKSCWSEHKAIENLSQVLNLKETCGYVTFINTGVPDIGCEEYDINVHLKKPKSRANINKERRRSSVLSQSKTSTSDMGSITSEDVVS